MRKWIVNPLNETVKMLVDIAEGEGDLTSRLVVHSNDELGLLAKNFNLFVDKMHKSVSDVVSTISNLSASAT